MLFLMDTELQICREPPLLSYDLETKTVYLGRFFTMGR